MAVKQPWFLPSKWNLCQKFARQKLPMAWWEKSEKIMSNCPSSMKAATGSLILFFVQSCVKIKKHKVGCKYLTAILTRTQGIKAKTKDFFTKVFTYFEI